MRLDDIMSTHVESIRAGETLEQADRQMRLTGIHHLVVVDGHKVVGLLGAAALQTCIAEGVGKVEDAMFRHVATAKPDMTVTEAARMMRGRPEGALPVLSGKRLAGIVTISDLLDVLGGRSRRSVRAHPTPRPRPARVRRA